MASLNAHKIIYVRLHTLLSRCNSNTPMYHTNISISMKLIGKMFHKENYYVMYAAYLVVSRQ